MKSQGMRSEWERVPVSAIAEPVLGGTPSKNNPDYWEDGEILWATAKDIASTRGRFIYSTEKRISLKGLTNSAAKLLPKGTIVITARGTVGALARLGREMAFNQTCYGLVPDMTRVSEDYLYYALIGTLSHMKTVTYGTVFETITKKSFDSWFIPLPPLPEQRAIAHILGTLDDKIELNRRMNETLEAMAQAIFKSWFVDFDPVVVNALKAGNPIPDKFAQCAAHYRDNPSALGLPDHILRLFPKRFVDSELGPIPEGWEVKQLGTIAVHPRRNLHSDEINPGTPYIALEHMPKKSISLLEWENSDGLMSNKLEFRRGEILFGKLRPYFHKVGVAPIDGVCSTDIVVVAPSEFLWYGLVLCHVSSNQFIAYCTANSTGTKMPRTNWKDMANYKIVCPPGPIAFQFTRIMQLFIDRIIANIHQSHSLASIQDTLLPNLISGKLRIKDAERFVEANI